MENEATAIPVTLLEIGSETLKRTAHIKVYYVVKFLSVLCALGLIVGFQFAAEPKLSAPGAKPMEDRPGVHNLFVLGTNVYSGSTPEGEAGFAALAKLGVKTIISVDGAKPDILSAKKFGIRYVHLPHGYDGISTNLQLQLAKAAEELDGPVYVHCHHGKHRGPTAAAVICMARDSWTAAQAEQWLKAAGTSTNYAGLYEVVRQFKKPEALQLKALPAEFPEVAKVSGLVDAMVAIDDTWEHLKAIRAAGYQTPKNHPDMKASNEAVILWEHYREAQRLSDAAHHGADFVARLRSAESEVKEAGKLLRELDKSPKPELHAQLDASFDAIGKTCSSCHKQYRDQ